MWTKEKKTEDRRKYFSLRRMEKESTVSPGTDCKYPSSTFGLLFVN
jgi:hypothetical protein